MTTIIGYRSGMSNLYFLKKADSAVLVDSGAETGEEAVFRCLESTGLSRENIRLIIITHGHVDHFMNAKTWSDITNAPVLCHENAKAFLEEGLLPDVDLEGRTKMGRELWEHQKKMGNPVNCAPKVPVDICMGDEDMDLKDFGVDGRIIFTPGHTKGCLSVVSGNEAVVGDLFAAPAATRAAEGMAYFQFIGAPYAMAEDSVQKLLDLGIRKFWPGHGVAREDSYVREVLENERNGKEIYYTIEEIEQLRDE